MNEYPMLMSTPMVQAYMAELKDRTRRLNGLHEINKDPDKWVLEGLVKDGAALHNGTELLFIKYPYGPIGGTLWFRESWTIFLEAYAFKADSHIFKGLKWRPSIHMPKEIARFKPKILKYRLERLQDITEEDAINEGIEQIDKDSEYKRWKDYLGWFDFFMDPRMSYMSLWDMLNNKSKPGKKAYPWDYNPWVWVVEFEKFK